MSLVHLRYRGPTYRDVAFNITRHTWHVTDLKNGFRPLYPIDIAVRAISSIPTDWPPLLPTSLLRVQASRHSSNQMFWIGDVIDCIIFWWQWTPGSGEVTSIVKYRPAWRLLTECASFQVVVYQFGSDCVDFPKIKWPNHRHWLRL